MSDSHQWPKYIIRAQRKVDKEVTYVFLAYDNTGYEWWPSYLNQARMFDSQEEATTVLRKFAGQVNTEWRNSFPPTVIHAASGTSYKQPEAEVRFSVLRVDLFEVLQGPTHSVHLPPPGLVSQ